MIDVTDQPHEERPPRPEQQPETPAAARIRHQQTWVDLQLRQARERGDFDDLPGYGKPLTGLGDAHDPDWWVKQLLEREQITGVVPPSLQLRRDDAELDARLDRLGSEAEVRREVDEFNQRVRWALYRPPEGPPVVTPQRDPATEVERWRSRRAERAARRRTSEPPAGAPAAGRPPALRRLRTWFRRSSRR